VTFLGYAISLFEHDAHAAFYVLHALPQTHPDENSQQDGNQDNRDCARPPTVEYAQILQCWRLYR
jgi:hypothetical protein